MLNFLFKKRFLGIDVGTYSIKVIELSSFGGRIKLENFGEIPAKAVFKKPFRTFEKNTLSLALKDIVRATKAVFEEAGIKAKKVFFSIPDFATFFTTFELPPMTKEEIPSAVEIEARRHVPVPLSEVAFDWQILNKMPKKGEKIKILLVAVPLEVVNQYKAFAESLKLKLISLEPEVFSLARVFGQEDKVVALFDLGARSTTCSIVERKTLYTSFSLDIGGDFFSERIAKGLGIEIEKGEKLKREVGLAEESKVREILIPLLNSIIHEGEKIFQNYEGKRNRKVEKIILTGGNANLPGLVEYFKIQFKREVEIGNPFKKIFYPPILEETLKEMGPSFAVATGLALRGFEK